jgi:hypothetical protein
MDDISYKLAPVDLKDPRAFNHSHYDAARMQGGQWQLLAAWADMRPSQRTIYEALDRLRRLKNICGCSCDCAERLGYCGGRDAIRAAEEAVAIAREHPDCQAYDAMIRARRHSNG